MNYFRRKSFSKFTSKIKNWTAIEKTDSWRNNTTLLGRSLKIDGEKRPELTKPSNIWDRDTTVQVYNFVAIKRPDKWQASCESRLIEKQEGVPRKEAGRFYGGSLSGPLVPRLNFVLLLTVLNGVGLSSAFLLRLINSLYSANQRNRLELTIFTNLLSYPNFARNWQIEIYVQFRYLTLCIRLSLLRKHRT